MRRCVALENSAWKLAVANLYAGEVDKRATEDRCLQRHRDAGDIR